MDLGNKILELRKKRGYSQEELAEILNVSRQTISKWETNQSNPELDKAIELSNLFQISLDDLTNNKIEILAANKTFKDEHLIKSLIGKKCKIELYEGFVNMSNPNCVCTILEIDNEWLRLEYLYKKEVVLKLIDMNSVRSFQIIEEE